jgi:predicted phage terminase large subunit-like protein
MAASKWDKLIKDYEEHCKRISKATTVNINEKPGDKIDRIKRLEKDYIAWFEYYFPQYAKKKSAWFHVEMAELIIKNKIADLLGEVYRSGAKSVHLGMGIPLFLYYTKDLFYMLLIGQTDPKARKLIGKIQAQLKSNQRLINDYGKRFNYGDWSDGDFTTTDGVKFKAMSYSRQSPRGESEEENRPDYILLDDVDTKQRVNNDKLTREGYEWAWEDLRGTFDEGGLRRRFIVANNNFHPNCLINLLKKEFKIINEKAKAAGRKIKHFIVTAKAVKDLETFEPEWPEKTDSEYWKVKFEETPYRSFMREYMHTHIQDGVIFKHEQMQFKARLPFEMYDGMCFYGDLSYKDAGDYKAMVLVGKTGREFHILAAYVRKTSRSNVAKWLYDYVADNQLLTQNVRYKIEGLFAQDEFVNDFDIEGDERGWYVPVVADKKSKEGKYDRIESMEGYFERGNVWFNEDYKGSTDFQNLIDQLLSFEKGSGANDDGPDALQSAIVEVNQVTFVTKFNPKTVSRRELNNNKKNRF